MKAFEEEIEPAVLVQWFCPLRDCCLLWVAVRLHDVLICLCKGGVCRQPGVSTGVPLLAGARGT